MKVKTIDINTKEWFDKVTGNSYFAGEVVVDLGRKSQKDYIMPYQYGYGESYIQEAKKLLVEFNMIDASSNTPLWRYCEDNNIILQTNKQEKCLLRDLKKYKVV